MKKEFDIEYWKTRSECCESAIEKLDKENEALQAELAVANAAVSQGMEIEDRLQAEVERLREAIEIHKEEAEASMPNQKLWDKADRQEGEG